MHTIALCQKLLDVTYYVLVLHDGEKVGEGSAVCYSSEGGLLTAAHVIDNRLSRDGARLDPGFVKDPELKVMARLPAGPLTPYALVQVGLEINVPTDFKDPLIVDLAVLRPLSPVTGKPFLPLRQQSAPIGTDVLLSGYPDEIRVPFDFDRKVDWALPGPRGKQHDLELLANAIFVKRGMIGQFFPTDLTCTLVNETGQKAIRILGYHYWIDQSSHPGASGGPVVDMDGNLVGIICQRGTTDASSADHPDLRVPSGSTLAVSPSFIMPIPL